MKVCKKCGKEKDKNEFYGVQGECKECTKKRVSKNYRDNIKYYKEYDRDRQKKNFNRMFLHRYSSIKTRVEGRHHRTYKKVEGTEIMSRDEFIDWCYSTEVFGKFMNIYREWDKSGFKRINCPSIDRIDEKGSYTEDNIQWLSLKDNMKKYYKK